jgi:hypothetical protein
MRNRGSHKRHRETHYQKCTRIQTVPNLEIRALSQTWAATIAGYCPQFLPKSLLIYVGTERRIGVSGPERATTDLFRALPTERFPSSIWGKRRSGEQRFTSNDPRLRPRENQLFTTMPIENTTMKASQA